MRHLHFHDPIDALSAKRGELTALQPDIAILFAGPAVLAEETASGQLKTLLDGIPSIGCGTAGEIGQSGVTDKLVSLLAIKFDDSNVRLVQAPLSSIAASQDAGAALAAQLPTEKLKAVFLLGPGVEVNGSELVKGLRQKLSRDVVVTGGLAGDGGQFKLTHQWINGETHTDRVVAVGFYGDNLQVGAGSQGGWNKFGPRRRVTRSEGNILQELDSSPALRLYEQYLGDKAANLPSSGLLYPFAILNEENAESGLIRTILNVDRDAGSLTLAGDLPQDSQVCLMHADTDSLSEGAAGAASLASHGIATDGSGVALLVSCVGRKIVMGDEVEDEIDAVKAVLGKDTALAGFYSYGEICPFTETGVAELHNQTMTITYLYERSAA